MNTNFENINNNIKKNESKEISKKNICNLYNCLENSINIEDKLEVFLKISILLKIL